MATHSKKHPNTPQSSWLTIGLSLVLTMTLFSSFTPKAAALEIIRNNIGGDAQPTAIGTDNLVDIFQAVADQCEHAIQDDHTVVINFGWESVGGGQHTLNRQSGTPNREVEGTILFNKNTHQGNFQW